MTKADLVDSVYEQFDGEITKKLTGEVLAAAFMGVAQSIKKEGRFSWPDFGTFVRRTRKARMGRNPQTNTAMKIKASKSVGFKVSRKLKAAL